jgi:hypothetical protein
MHNKQVFRGTMAYNDKVIETLGKFMKVVNKKKGWRCIEFPSKRSMGWGQQ